MSLKAEAAVHEEVAIIHASGIGGSCGREDSTGPGNYWGAALNEYYADDTLNEVLGI